MLVRGGSPVNGATSSLDGPTLENSLLNTFLLPSSAGDNGRAVSSAVGPAAAGLPSLALRPAASNSSGRNARPCSSADMAPALRRAFSAAACCLRRLTSGSLGQAGLLVTVVSVCGGGRLRF